MKCRFAERKRAREEDEVERKRRGGQKRDAVEIIKIPRTSKS